MSRSKKNWDELIDFYGNYNDVDRNVGVKRIIAGEGVLISPPMGIGDVRIAVDPGPAVLKGEDISVLNNDVGYIKGIDHLNDIGDVNVPSPKKGQVLTWSGSEWKAQISAIPDSFAFRGKKNVAVDHPEADPKQGWTYVQAGASGVTPLPSWVGIETESVDENDLIVYGVSEWTVIKGAFDIISFDDLNAQNNPTPQPGYPGGYLDYDDTTATFTLYPAELSELPDLTDPTPQPGTLDDRYVNLTGDTMTGPLALSGQNINAAGDLTLEGSLYLDGVNTVGNDNIRMVVAQGGHLDFGLRDTALEAVATGVSIRRHTNDKVYLHLAEEPVLPTMAVNLAYLMDTLSDLEDDFDDKYVLTAGDTMTGSLILDSGTATPTDLTLENGALRVKGGFIYADHLTSFAGKDLDLRYASSLKQKIGGTTTYHYQLNMYSNFTPVLAHAHHLTHKKYVDDADQILSTAIDDLDTKVDNLELGIPEAEADLKYLHDITVAATNQVAYDQPANVTVANKSELTFDIPEGQKGDDGVKGIKGEDGEKGQKGVDGVIGVDGEKGEPGEKGVKGATGAKGADIKGAKGQKGQKGAGSSDSTNYVVRGNTTSNIRIYYSGGRYYIAGTS